MPGTFDILIRNAALRSRPGQRFDIGIKDAGIGAIESGLDGSAALELDAAGNLVTESFANPHLHLCKVYTLEKMDEEALMIGGGLMGAGGAFLSLAQLGSFTHGIIAGRGRVCIALIIFAHWEPVRVLWGALLFGGVFALQLRLQTTGAQLPYETFLALPYLVTILALAVAGRAAAAPAALLKPYRQE